MKQNKNSHFGALLIVAAAVVAAVASVDATNYQEETAVLLSAENPTAKIIFKGVAETPPQGEDAVTSTNMTANFSASLPDDSGDGGVTDEDAGASDGDGISDEELPTVSLNFKSDTQSEDGVLNFNWSRDTETSIFVTAEMGQDGKVEAHATLTLNEPYPTEPLQVDVTGIVDVFGDVGEFKISYEVAEGTETEPRGGLLSED